MNKNKNKNFSEKLIAFFVCFYQHNADKPQMFKKWGLFFTLPGDIRQELQEVQGWREML